MTEYQRVYADQDLCDRITVPCVSIIHFQNEARSCVSARIAESLRNAFWDEEAQAADAGMDPIVFSILPTFEEDLWTA